MGTHAISNNESTNNLQEVYMNRIILIGTTMIVTAAIAFTLSAASWAGKGVESEKNYNQGENIQLGSRPFF